MRTATYGHTHGGTNNRDRCLSTKSSHMAASGPVQQWRVPLAQGRNGSVIMTARAAPTTVSKTMTHVCHHFLYNCREGEREGRDNMAQPQL